MALTWTREARVPRISASMLGRDAAARPSQDREGLVHGVDRGPPLAQAEVGAAPAVGGEGDEVGLLRARRERLGLGDEIAPAEHRAPRAAVHAEAADEAQPGHR